MVCVGMRRKRHKFSILFFILAQNWYGINVLDAVRVKRAKNTHEVPEAQHFAPESQVVFALLPLVPFPVYR